MKRTEVRKRMGLTDERAEAAKGQMLAYIRDSVDRWNERTAQEQADADLPDMVWQQAQTEQADAAAATEAHNEHADAAAAPKRRRFKTKRPAAVVESSNEQAAAAEEAPNEEAGTAAAEEAPNKQPEDTPPDQQPGLSFVDWQLAQANLRLVVENMLADPVAETINDVQPELAAADGQWAATPSGCSRSSSVFSAFTAKKPSSPRMVSRGIQRRANRSLRPMSQRLQSPLRLRQQMQHRPSAFASTRNPSRQVSLSLSWTHQ